jgi:hypothetical protein
MKPNCWKCRKMNCWTLSPNGRIKEVLQKYHERVKIRWRRSKK